MQWRKLHNALTTRETDNKSRTGKQEMDQQQEPKGAYGHYENRRKQSKNATIK